MITVIKCSPLGEEQIRYPAEVLGRRENGIILAAYWNQSARDLGYTSFEPGDYFVEYFYTDRWFNIFAISSATGVRKGWYCNIAAPAYIDEERIEQRDLLLDVWISASGQTLILDEDEFAADTSLTAQQRSGAQSGLEALLALIRARSEPFQDM